MKKPRMKLTALSVICASGLNPAIAADQIDRANLPVADKAPQKYSQLDVRDVKRPDPQHSVQAPDGAPNVLVILLDDVGYSQSDLFGGVVEMPTLKELAKAGLTYNQFHTTAISAATRTALLTGLNHHQNNMSSIAETATAFPGNTGVRPNYVAAIPKVLKYNGYNTAMFGKNHEIPAWQTGPAGDQTLWPTNIGFEKFYGFFGGETDQFQPVLVDGVTRIETPRTPNYHFTTDMTDQAIGWLNLQHGYNTDKPFFLYYAPGATHAPHQAPKEWIDKYKGKFDAGWDVLRTETFERQKKLGIIPSDTKLPPMPDYIPRWDSLTEQQKKVYSRQMEVFAGFLAHTDHEIGRVIDNLKANGEFDNTLIFYVVGDNGASSEGNKTGSLNSLAFYNGISEDETLVAKNIDKLGSPDSFGHYAAGWAVAGDTPFAWTKAVASDYGGTSNAMVVSWPKGIDAKNNSTLRKQWSHVTDIVPTILDAAKLPEPKTVDGIKVEKIVGSSLLPTFNDGKAKSKHTTQYFEVIGNRAIYHDGWFARVLHFPLWENTTNFQSLKEEDDKWELFDTTKDFSLSNNVAKENPQKLKELRALFDSEAERYNVYPIDDRKAERLNAEIAGRPDALAGKTSLTLYPGATGIPENSFLNTKNKSWEVSASVDINSGDKANGVIIAQAGNFAGWTMYMKEGKPFFEYNWLAYERTTLTADVLKEGTNNITMKFMYDENGEGGKGNALSQGKGGNAYLYINNKLVDKKHINNTISRLYSLDDGVDVGMDDGGAVSNEYKAPFKFNQKINSVTTRLIQ